MGKAILTVEGWHSQHMVFAMDFSAWNCFTEDEKAAARNELKAFLADLEAKHQAKEGSYAFYDCNGAKGDLILWILGPSLEYLAQVERKFRRLAIASVLVQTYSYTSVTEVSTYVKAKLDTEEVNQKLYPHVPRDKYICFYNMSKKREGDDNWFMLPPQERGALMKSHGELGKTYLDVLSEFTTGGCGLDDWEWGITIFSNDDIQFKKIVYDMRFEVASAKYGIFSDFYVGTIIDDALLEEIFG